MLLPRAIVAWVQAIEEYQGGVPGVGGYVAFSKSEKGYEGAAEVQGSVRGFSGSQATVVAHLLVALDADSTVTPLSGESAQRLGKSLDVLAMGQVMGVVLRTSPICGQVRRLK